MIQHAGEANSICLLRRHIPIGKRLLVVVNLDDEKRTRAQWAAMPEEVKDAGFIDLLSGARVGVSESDEGYSLLLEPGQVLCPSRNEEDLSLLQELPAQPCGLPRPIEIQRLRAKVLDARSHYQRTEDLADFDVDRAARQLKEDPMQFCRDLNPDSLETRLITWTWPRDVNREVMIPPGHFIYVRADHMFRARLVLDHRTVAAETAFKHADGSFFALFKPVDPGNPALGR